MTPMMNIVALFLFAVLIQFGETLEHLKSIKLNGNITYDCIDIYKQSGLNHPLLKDHKIQLRPSSSIFKSKTRVSNRGYKKKLGCPKGTVPILRRREDVTNSSRLAEKHFNLLIDNSLRTHIAGMKSEGKGPYRGVRVGMNCYQLDCGKDQATFAQAYIGSVVNGQVNFIQAGWMISPDLYHDGRTWSYGYWKGNNGIGCYNTDCPGFVQVSRDVPLSEPMIHLGHQAYLQFSIHQDEQTGNWWITQEDRDNLPNVDIGYWPKELFNLLGNGATTVGFGGYVQADPSGMSPMMGNGQFPSGDPKNSAYFSNLQIMNSNYEVFDADNFPLEKMTNSKCYGLQYKGWMNKDVGDVFLYGGPGGNSCA